MDFIEKVCVPDVVGESVVVNSEDGSIDWYAMKNIVDGLDLIFLGWVPRLILSSNTYEVNFRMAKLILK